MWRILLDTLISMKHIADTNELKAWLICVCIYLVGDSIRCFMALGFILILKEKLFATPKAFSCRCQFIHRPSVDMSTSGCLHSIFFFYFLFPFFSFSCSCLSIKYGKSQSSSSPATDPTISTECWGLSYQLTVVRFMPANFQESYFYYLLDNFHPNLLF